MVKGKEVSLKKKTKKIEEIEYEIKYDIFNNYHDFIEKKYSATPKQSKLYRKVLDRICEGVFEKINNETDNVLRKKKIQNLD